MKRHDWHNMCSSTSDVIIQFDPLSGQVRARRKDDLMWKYVEPKKGTKINAIRAISLGESLLNDSDILPSQNESFHTFLSLLDEDDS